MPVSKAAKGKSTSMKKKNKNERIKGFTKMPNAIIKNSNLSLAAKGMALQFAFNKPGWITYQAELFSRSTDAKSAQRRALKELTDHGLISIERTRNTQTGHFQYEYRINREAFYGTALTQSLVSPLHEKPLTVRPDTDNPDTVEPIADVPSTVNDSLSNTNNSNTNTSNTNTEVRMSKSKDQAQKTTDEFKAPGREQVIAFFKDKGYSVAGALAFFEEFERRQWYTVQGEKVQNWKGLAVDFMKRKGRSFFELLPEELEHIKRFADKLYAVIYESNKAEYERTKNYQLLNPRAKDIKEWLTQLCYQEGFNAYAQLHKHLEENKLDTKTFYALKKSLGLKSDNDKGTKHI